MLVAAAIACWFTAASANPVRHAERRHRSPPPHGSLIQQRSVATFGGVPRAEPDGATGNLPFANQLRKFSDPLGANGR